MLPENDSVKIEIFDIQGKKVDEPFNGFLRAGRHEIKWSAGDMMSGVYSCKITTSDTTIT